MHAGPGERDFDGYRITVILPNQDETGVIFEPCKDDKRFNVALRGEPMGLGMAVLAGGQRGALSLPCRSCRAPR